MVTLRNIISLTVWFTCSTSLFAQVYTVNWETPVTVNASGPAGRVRPRISLMDGDDPVIVWGNVTPGEVYASSWSGSGFTTPVRVSPAGLTAYVRSWIGPSVSAAGDTVFCGYDYMDADGRSYLQRSTDGGLTWGDTLRPDIDTGPDMTRFCTAEARSGNDVFVAFLRADSMDMDPEYVLTHSTDGGLTFSPDVNFTQDAAGPVCDCCPPGLAVSGDRIALFFRNNDSNRRDISAAISSDAGLTVDTVLDIDKSDWMIASCPSTGPDGYFASDSLFAAWMTGYLSPGRIYAGSAHATSYAFGSNVDLSATASQNFPRMAGNGDTLGLIWEDNRTGDTELFFAWSTNGLTGLESPVNVSLSPAGAQKNPDIAYHNGAFHLTWQDDEHLEVRYMKGTIALLYAASTQPPIGLNAFPNPTADRFLLHTDAVSGTVVLSGADGVVHRVYPRMQFPLEVSLNDLPEGMYFCRIITAEGSAAVKVVKNGK